MHVKDPVVIAPGWVRVTSAYSMHAYAIRAEWYERVLAAMRKPDPGGRVPGCDVALTRLSGEIPMYACYPNLAWQAAGFSDLKKMVRSPYGDDGRQLIHPRLVKRLEAGMRCQLAALTTAAVEEGVR
jgi:hypothetical protein